MFCYVRSCPNSQSHFKKKKDSDLANYFTSPEDKALLEKWRRVIPKTDHVFTQNDYLCDSHFLNSEVLWFTETKLPNGNVRRLLRDEPVLKVGTIPSIFPAETDENDKSTTTLTSSSSGRQDTSKPVVKVPSVPRGEKFVTPKSVMRNSNILKTPVPIKKEPIETPKSNSRARVKEAPPALVEKRNPQRVKRRSTILDDYITDDELNLLHNQNSGSANRLAAAKKRKTDSPGLQPIIRLVPLESLMDKNGSRNKALNKVEGSRPSTEEIDLELKKVIEIPLLTNLRQNKSQAFKSKEIGVLKGAKKVVSKTTVKTTATSSFRTPSISLPSQRAAASGPEGMLDSLNEEVKMEEPDIEEELARMEMDEVEDEDVKSDIISIAQDDNESVVIKSEEEEWEEGCGLNDEMMESATNCVGDNIGDVAIKSEDEEEAASVAADVTSVCNVAGSRSTTVIGEGERVDDVLENRDMEANVTGGIITAEKSQYAEVPVVEEPQREKESHVTSKGDGESGNLGESSTEDRAHKAAVAVTEKGNDSKMETEDLQPDSQNKHASKETTNEVERKSDNPNGERATNESQVADEPVTGEKYQVTEPLPPATDVESTSDDKVATTAVDASLAVAGVPKVQSDATQIIDRSDQTVVDDHSQNADVTDRPKLSTNQQNMALITEQSSVERQQSESDRDSQNRITKDEAVAVQPLEEKLAKEGESMTAMEVETNDECAPVTANNESTNIQNKDDNDVHKDNADTLAHGDVEKEVEPHTADVNKESGSAQESSVEKAVENEHIIDLEKEKGPKETRSEEHMESEHVIDLEAEELQEDSSGNNSDSNNIVDLENEDPANGSSTHNADSQDVIDIEAEGTKEKSNAPTVETEDDIDIEAEVARLESEVGEVAHERNKGKRRTDKDIINVSISEDEEQPPRKKAKTKETNQCQEIILHGNPNMGENSGVQNLFSPETIQEILKQIKLPLTSPVTLRIAPMMNTPGSSTPSKGREVTRRKTKPMRKRGAKESGRPISKASTSKEICQYSIDQFRHLTKTRTVFEFPTFISDIEDDVQYWKLCQVIRESFHELIEARNTKTSIGKLTLNIAINKPLPPPAAPPFDCSTSDLDSVNS